MTDHQIITIGRQYGSGGREIGQQLAKELGFAFYDKELLAAAVKESGLSLEAFENADEKAINNILYSLALGAYNSTNKMAPLLDISITDKLFQLQSSIIQRIAEEESAVIIGRCADYVLREHPRCINVFLHADLDKRVERAINIYHLDSENAKENVTKIDKKRSHYYNYYTLKKWGLASNYHLAIDSGVIGVAGTVKLIKEYLTLAQ